MAKEAPSAVPPQSLLLLLFAPLGLGFRVHIMGVREPAGGAPLSLEMLGSAQ
jgi:hypothetical protein